MIAIISKYYKVALTLLFLLFLLNLGLRWKASVDDIKQNGVVVIGTVTSYAISRGPTIVHVNFRYNGRSVDSYFHTYYPDSLRKGIQIRLRISKKDPQNIEYIGVYTDQKHN